MSTRTAAKTFASVARDCVHPRLSAVNAVLAVTPTFASGYVRARLYRFAGIDVDPTAFLMANITVRGGSKGHVGRIHIGRDVRISTDVTINSDDDVTIEENVCIGPFVRIYTTTHGLGPGSSRSDRETITKPVTIGRGSWLAMGVSVLPGVTIGHGSVIGAGAVVANDIPPDSYAEGVPAAVVRTLPLGNR